MTGLLSNGFSGGVLELTKEGPGTLSLNRIGNTFSGNIVVNGGVLAYLPTTGSADQTALGVGAKTITLNNNAVLRPTASSDPNVAGGKGFVIGPTGGTFDTPAGVTFILNDGLSNASAQDQLQGNGTLTK